MTVTTDYSYYQKQLTGLRQTQFYEFIDLADQPSATFAKVYASFQGLQTQTPRLDYDYEIADDTKGSQFYKVAEIKGQQAHRVVDPILLTTFEASQIDGYTRNSLMRDEPEGPLYKERIFIRKHPDGELVMIYVQIMKEDLFACLNEVKKVGGKYHWIGTYLYGKPCEPPEVDEKLTTFNNMLRFIEDPEFDRIYEGLESLLNDC